MDKYSGQSVMQEISQQHSTNDSTDAVIKEVLKLVALSGLLQENPHQIWSYCNVNACSVSWNQLHKFCKMIIPKPKQSDSFADQLSACAKHIKFYIDSELSPVAGTTYRDLRQFVEAIDMSRYFECGFAGSRLIDMSSCDDYEAKPGKPSDVNISDNDHQSSDDDSLGKVMTSLNDSDQVVVKVDTSQSDVKLSVVLNGDGFDSSMDNLVKSLTGQRRRGRPKSGRPTFCLHCGKQFPTPSALSMHVRTHTGHRPYTCSQCWRSFTQLSHMTRHKHQRHETYKPYVCAYCHRQFASALLLRAHLRSHGIVASARSSRRHVQYVCNVCDLRKSKRHQMISHIRVHTGERPYLCSKCGRGFAVASSFYRHWQSHARALTVPCPLCSKNFASVEQLRQHQRTHSDCRPHVCFLCSRAFKRPCDLRCHFRTHTGQRPYACHLCSAAFTQHSSLRYHLLVHSNKRNHTCPVCSRGFRTADKLRIHTLVHSGERPHTCDTCGRNFGDRSSFRRHMRRHSFKKDIT